MDDFEKELKTEFLMEAKQAVEDVEQCFLELEANPENSKNLDKIFRLAHNLKGSSKAVGFSDLGDFTHEFEWFIIRIKNKELSASAKVIDILLRATDHVGYILDRLTEDPEAKIDSLALMTEMQNYQDENVTSPASRELNAADIEIENASAIAGLHGAGVSASGAGQIKSAGPATEETLRVSLHKVEHLINSVGEMVILHSGLKQQANALNSHALKKIVQHLSKVSKEIQEASMSLRMVPIKPVLQKMQRIVRDTSQSLKKDVGLQLMGEETDIDKTVLERISDPLVHLVRNACDHGIEDLETRRARNKADKGSITIKASHQSGKLVIEVIDDGGGLDPEKLKRKATEKGIITKDAKLTDVEAFNLIFAPGFSTKEQVTDVSGRGVGMDVVKTNIQEMGGEIQIQSQIGKGSTFKIILPLTLAIVDAMVLQYSTETFVIPINQVYETLKPDARQLQESAFGDILLLREENLPLYRLGGFFGIPNKKAPTEMIAIVIRIGEKPFAFLVDDIIGQSQVVIKQLGPELQWLVGVSGSTILGDGKPALILEAQDLLKRKSVNTRPRSEISAS